MTSAPATLDIRLLGDPILRRATTPVAHVDDALRALLAAMFATMDAAPGQGLAAPQVGRLERVCVVDVAGVRRALVNPVIVHREGRQTQEDGCLSLPGIHTTVERSARVVVRALDLDGASMELDADGPLAFCLQHEIDHLDGRLFFDHLSVVRRRAVLAAWERAKGKYPGLRWRPEAPRVGARAR